VGLTLLVENISDGFAALIKWHAEELTELSVIQPVLSSVYINLCYGTVFETQVTLGLPRRFFGNCLLSRFT